MTCHNRHDGFVWMHVCEWLQVCLSTLCTMNWPLWSLGDCWLTNDNFPHCQCLTQSFWSFVPSHKADIKSRRSHRYTQPKVFNANSLFTVTRSSYFTRLFSPFSLFHPVGSRWTSFSESVSTLPSWMSLYRESSQPCQLGIHFYQLLSFLSLSRLLFLSLVFISIFFFSFSAFKLSFWKCIVWLNSGSWLDWASLSRHIAVKIN